MRLFTRTPAIFLPAALLLLCAMESQAQWAPTRAEVEVSTTVPEGETIPFWLHAGRDGLVDPASSGVRLRGRASRSLSSEKRFAYGYGIEWFGRASARSTVLFPALYGELRYGFLEFRLGRKADRIGTSSGPISSGSLGQSRNATPIPKVVFSTDGYTPVPFTRRWIQFKGRYADGLLPDGRYVENPYLHQKTFYLEVGGPTPVQIYGGLVHNAMWGGTSPDFGRLPQSLNDYVRTIFALHGAEDAPRSSRVYIQGDHFGIIDLGLRASIGPLQTRIYRHFIYEDRDNLKFKSPQDGLLGIELKADGGLLDHLVYEHLYTKWQNGPIGPNPDNPRGGPGGRDNYYNHGTYKSGWTLYGRTAGSPLLTPFQNGRVGIANNRVVGHHLGAAGHLGPLRYRALATYTRNYGKYGRPLTESGAPLEQVSLLFEGQARWPGTPALKVSAGIGADIGQMYEDGAGLQLGLTYHIYPSGQKR